MTTRYLATFFIAAAVVAAGVASEPPIRRPAGPVSPGQASPDTPPVKVASPIRLPVPPALQVPPPSDEPHFEANEPKLPWKLADLYWQNFDRNEPTYTIATPERVEIDVTVLTETHAPLFIVPITAGTPKTKFNAGFLNSSSRLVAGRKSDGTVLYGRSGTQDPATLLPATKNADELSTPNAMVVTTQTPFDWSKPGRYTFELTAMHADRLPDAAEPVQRWVGLTVLDHRTGNRSFAGAVRHPTDKFEFPQFCFGSFIQVCGLSGTTQPLTLRIPRTVVAFGNVRIDGQPFQPSAVVAYYDPKAPQLARATTVEDYLKAHPEDAAGLRDTPESVVVEVSAEIFRANQAKPREPWAVVYRSRDRTNGRDPVAYTGKEFERKMGITSGESGRQWFTGPGSIVRDRRR